VTDDVTDEDNGLRDFERPGFDKCRFKRSEKTHQTAMKAAESDEDREQIEKRFEAYKQSLMSHAAANWDSIMAQYKQPEASENTQRELSRKSNKELIIAAFFAFLLFSSAIIKQQQR
jgi:hypothetical protein